MESRVTREQAKEDKEETISKIELFKSDLNGTKYILEKMQKEMGKLIYEAVKQVKK